MKKFLSILLLLINITCYSQSGGVRVYLEKPNLLYRGAIIYFSDTCTDGFDQFNDAILFGSDLNNIWTTIGTNKYVVNTFGPLVEDRNIPIGAYIFPDTGLFIIGIDQTYGGVIPYALLDNQVPGYHSMPYYCQGPVSNERFSIHFEKPMEIEVISDCEFGYVVIDNDEPNVAYTLTSEFGVSYLPPYTDTIFDLPSGDYTLSLYDSITEQVTFSIDNTVLDATLYIPYTHLYIGDSYVTPILNIYSPYNDILWDFGDGTTLYNDINPVHYYNQAGVYTLRAIVSEGQCSRIFESQIIVELIGGFTQINKPVYRPTNSFYAIDGKLIKKL
jgi:hypothetical protein